MKMKTYRIVFLGAEGVGKTSLILQFMHGRFNGNYTPTLEDCYRHVAKLPNGLFQHIEILDTCGDDQFPVMRDLNIRTGNAFVVVYAVDSMTSFYEAQNLCNRISKIKGDKKVPVVMVGNKTDLKDSWVVPTELAFRSAAMDLNCSFVETSAKCNINVGNAFDVLLPDCPHDKKCKKELENCKSSNSLFGERFRRRSTSDILKVKPRIKKFHSLDYGRRHWRAQCTIL